jgi:HlyD family secretion protein
MVVVLGTVAGCNPSQGIEPKARAAEAGTQAESIRSVTVTRLTGRAYSSSIQATGTALPFRESILSFPVPGRLDSVLVQPGDRVKKGQVLMRLEREGFFLGVEQAGAAVAAAKVGLDSLELEMKRFDKLIDNKAVPRATYDKIKAQRDGAAAQYTMADVAQRQAKKALRDAQLRAPYNGVVSDVFKEVGEFIPSMPPTPVLKLVDASSLEVQVFLPEAEAPYASKGQQVRVRIDSAGVETSGRILFVSDRIQPMTHNFEVRIAIDNTDGNIKAGAFARVEIPRQAESQEQAIFVPLRAVQRDAAGEPFVFVAKDGSAVKMKVDLGETLDDQTMVRCCLKADQLLITSGLSELSPGDSIRVAAD